MTDGEIIKSIEEKEFRINPDDWCSYEGFIVTTSDQEIKLGISSGQSCCEQYGYFMSEDNISEFIGSKLINVTITDTGLNTKQLPEYGLDEGGVMFVNLETSQGTLQFVAYNAHNGYYGHEAIVQSKQITKSESI